MLAVRQKGGTERRFCLQVVTDGMPNDAEATGMMAAKATAHSVCRILTSQQQKLPCKINIYYIF